jgi:hypothetical protein
MKIEMALSPKSSSPLSWQEALSLEQKQKLLRLHSLIVNLKDIARKDPISLWIPFPKQETGLYSEKRFIFYTGANRTGKSDFLSAYFSLFLLGRHPSIKTPRNAVAWLSVTDFSKIEQVLLPKFLRMLPENSFIYNNQKSLLEMKNGAKLFFKSEQSGPLSYEGADVDLLGLDEEHAKNTFNAAVIRTTGRKARILIAATLVGGITWMYDDFILPTQKDERKDVELIVCSQFDNPMLDKAEVQKEFERMSKSDPIKARICIMGEFLDISGETVFPTMLLFNKRKELADMKILPRRGEILEA